jgi:plastocyanin
MRDMKRLMHGVLATALLMACGEPTATAPGTAGRGNGGHGSGGSDASESVTVSVGTNFFRSNRNGSVNAAVDTIVVGGKVTWKWMGAGSAPHNVASIGMPSFTSGDIKTGDGSTDERTFTSPGTYRYNCAIHGNLMTGVVVVTAE